MADIQMLRVGVCACTTLYHGELEGEQFIVRGLPFLLQECVISEEGGQRDSLRENRCHFFLDVHGIGPHKPNLDVTLACVDLVPTKGQRDHLFIRGLGESRWQGDPHTPPSVQSILDAISCMIGKLSEAKFQRWLSR